MAFNLTLEKFNGPLDLMLHLIQEQKLDIFDLDMEVLTDQYLAYIEGMEELHLEIESEYLVELATLIEYKSRKLLPTFKEEDPDEEDLKDDLVRRLLEYQRFKEAAKELSIAYMARQENMAKDSGFADMLVNKDNFALLNGNPLDLYRAMAKVLKRWQLNKPLKVANIQTQEISIEDRILSIKARLYDLPDIFTFNDLCDDCHSLNAFIVSFLALLELAKEHVLYFNVDKDDTIWLKRAGD